MHVLMISEDIKQTLLEYDRPVPRYTSYPTAPNFKPVDMTASPYTDLKNESRLSLYIHVPFCTQMCWYCGCHTKVTQKYEPIAEYVTYLCKEIELVAGSISSTPSVSHIHFGGGSPSILSAEDFRIIINNIRTYFNLIDKAEIAIEIDPRGLTHELVKAYADSGVNRISLGAQDFNDTVMDSVNRSQPFSLSEQTVKLFRDHGIDHINLDLIYGLPNQNLETVKRTMDLALSLNPDRIAYFGYAHVPWMKKHMRLIDETTLPDKAMRYDLFHTGAAILENCGYLPVGIDHFVHPDDSMARAAQTRTLRRNFQGYTTDSADHMIGLGVSSIGKTHDLYVQNSPDMPVYKRLINQGRLPIAKTCPISPADKTRAAIIERIMCDFQVDLSDFEGQFDNELMAIAPYMQTGLVTYANNVITVSKEARLLARLVAAAFDEYLPPVTEQKHSKAI